MQLARRSQLRIGLTAAAGAVGVAAMMAAATAPNARADDFTTILDDTEIYTSAAQTDFTAAEGDFSSGLSGVPDGLDELFSGLNNASIAPDEFIVASVSALEGDPLGILTPGPIVADPPEADLATGLTDAQNVIGFADTDFTDAAQNLAAGNLVTALAEYFDGTYYLNFAPEDVLSGAVDQLLGSI
jgi:hypothetical protein